ncbi:hypothetical protein JOQ06_018931 [Pogonophryne albipinna]|uniref:HECT domain-containing protein n=1 Tax=Pogonophryne albipinna TaxID=1090488 RepID=A0AAD6ARY7_9TELE|nr:hypothetical protein JOQ06_018931 [Pogonophryne albipinna]
MSAQQPAQSLTDAAALLSSILASAETIGTLSNVTTTGPQTTVGAASGNTLDGIFGFLSLSKADSEEEKYLSTAAGSTDKDSDEDHCVIPAVTRSCVTTRAAFTDPYPSSNNGEGIPGSGSDDADTNDPATSGRKRRRESQGVDGSPGTSSQTTGWLSRDGNPGTSGYDYSSYLNLVSTLSQESSDDEEFNKAIIASMECQIAEKFSDDMGRQEEGIDLGGPRREYLRLLMETIARSPMFEGKENCKSLALDSTALREDRYYLAGRAIAVSLVHGGPPPNFLSPTIFSPLVKGSANPALEEIADPELLNKVRKVSESTTAEELEESTAPLLDYLANAGCLRPVHSDRDRELLVKDIVMFQVVHRVQGPFQRFCEGMKTLEGSNKRIAEERVVTYWRDYFQDAEEEQGPTKVQKILAFATGASVVPPIGFSPTPSVEFIHNGEDDFASTPLFPIANTYVTCIRLPLHVSYGVFKDKFDFALGNTYGFGRS